MLFILVIFSILCFTACGLNNSVLNSSSENNSGVSNSEVNNSDNGPKLDDLQVQTFTMQNDVQLSFEENKNAMIFSSNINKREYDLIVDLVGEGKRYVSMDYGILVTLAENAISIPLTEENVFGVNAKYSTQAFGSNKLQIYDVSEQVVTTDLQVTIKGEFLLQNQIDLLNDYVAKAYVCLSTSTGEKEYLFSNFYNENTKDNAVSGIYIAQKLLIDQAESLSSSAKAYLLENYIKVVEDSIVPTENVKIVSNQTVSGQTYDGEHNSAELTLTAELDGQTTSFKVYKWTCEKEDCVEIKGNVAYGKNNGFDINATPECFENASVMIDVYVPISTKQDLDYLGYAYQNDKQIELWQNPETNRYLLTNDIDYNEGANTVFDKYIVPIAAVTDGAGSAGASLKNGLAEWGIFGELNDKYYFETVLDGNNYSIKNAIIPYGSVFVYPYSGSIKAICNNNFIGKMAGQSQLKNIAFENLKFETPVDILGYADEDAKMYSSQNENLVGTKFEENGFINTNLEGSASLFHINYGRWGNYALNYSFDAGLVGSMYGGSISNVYVDAVMTNGSYGGNGQNVNGLIVSRIYQNEEDIQEVSVTNCVTRTAMWNAGALNTTGSEQYNNGMGSIVGRVLTKDENVVQNCFTITYSAEDNSARAINPEHENGIFPHGDGDILIDPSEMVCTNCAIYESLDDFMYYESDLIDEILTWRWCKND